MGKAQFLMIMKKIELPKVFEFVPARKPEQAKIGELVRFMHNPGNGRSAYWMQGRLERRVDNYNVSRQSGFTRNRFKVKELCVVNYWGELGDIPERLTVNLSKNTAWSLGNEVEMQTIGKKEAIMLKPSNAYDTNNDDEETANKSVKNDVNDSVKNEPGNKGLMKITPSESKNRKSISTIKKSDFEEHASPETEPDPYEPYENNQVRFLSNKDEEIM